MQNNTLFQFFHWYLRPEDKLWIESGQKAQFLSHIGITHVWLPPAYKSALGINEPGYAVYDLYDLGEFDQKNTIRTRYGTRAEYIAAINSFHEAGISVIADIVLNHKHGGDEDENVSVRQVNSANRNEFIGEYEQKNVRSRFTFPGRNKEYSDFIWDMQTFTGTSDDDEHIYLISNQYTNGQWEELLENENGNYDYLMGFDIEYRNPAVREELKKWGKWYVESTMVDGFRLDAVKHITLGFFNEWLEYLDKTFQKQFFTIGEYWQNNLQVLVKYLEVTQHRIHLFDIPLHYNFHEASIKGPDYDLRKILDNSLMKTMPQLAITFVDNHDTQPHQALASAVEEWFTPHAYALILLRSEGIPCVFYPNIYGAKYWAEITDGQTETVLTPVKNITAMLQVRAQLAYGEQHDYFDQPLIVGWTREGIEDKKHSGCAVLISSGDAGEKLMHIGKQHCGKVFRDICNNVNETISIDAEGNGLFSVSKASVSIWISEESLPQIKKADL